MNNLFTHYIPWTSDKDLTGFYNYHILNSPTDWVVFSDRDAWFCHPHYGLHIEQVIKEHGEKSNLFIGVTNRIATNYMTVKGMWTIENADLHHKKAVELWNTHGTEIEDITNRSPIGGVFMLVNKKLLRNRLLPTGMLLGGDNQLHYLAQENGDKVYMCKGIYIYHYYRGGDRFNKEHLS